jgi:hypothetical protein
VHLVKAPSLHGAQSERRRCRNVLSFNGVVFGPDLIVTDTRASAGHKRLDSVGCLIASEDRCDDAIDCGVASTTLFVAHAARIAYRGSHS